MIVCATPRCGGTIFRIDKAAETGAKFVGESSPDSIKDIGRHGSLEQANHETACQPLFELDDTAARTGDRRLASIAQLFHYLTGDSHVSLDAIVDLPDDATPAECVEALRTQVDEAVRAGGLPPDSERYLRNVVETIG